MTEVNNRFNTILENIYKLSIEDKLILSDLLVHNISELKREEFLINAKNENLVFSSNIEELKRSI